MCVASHPTAHAAILPSEPSCCRRLLVWCWDCQMVLRFEFVHIWRCFPALRTAGAELVLPCCAWLGSGNKCRVCAVGRLAARLAHAHRRCVHFCRRSIGVSWQSGYDMPTVPRQGCGVVCWYYPTGRLVTSGALFLSVLWEKRTACMPTVISMPAARDLSAEQVIGPPRL